MTDPDPDITVKVDVTNPGQFFACCGMLELADRLWPGAEGWFENGTFCLSCEKSVSDVNQLLARLLDSPEFRPKVTKSSVLQGSKLKLLPVIVSFPESVLRIDWWRNETRRPGKASRETCASSSFKTWSGNQSPQQILYARLLPAIRTVMKSTHRNWLSERVSLTGRFGFDHTAAVKSIDAGWSPDKLDIAVKTSPVVELLAMIGLQRFRPIAQQRQNQFQYRIWSEPCPLLVAPAKMAGAIPDHHSTRFVFEIQERGDYRFFGIATPQGASV